MLLLSSGPSGNAPLSKALVVLVAAHSVLVWVADWRHAFVLRPAAHLALQRQYWRVLSHTLVFLSSSELVLGALLAYQLRVVERLWGTYRYASFALAAGTVGAALEVAGLAALGVRAAATGPYVLLFAALVQYALDVPAAEQYDKWATYVVALQLLLASYPSSLVAGACGVVAGLLCRLPPLRAFRVGKRVRTLAAALLLPLLGTSSAPQRRRPGPADPQGPAAAQAGAAPISEQDVAALVAMGFPRARAEQALRRSGGSVEQAAGLLLDGRE